MRTPNIYYVNSFHLQVQQCELSLAYCTSHPEKLSYNWRFVSFDYLIQFQPTPQPHASGSHKSDLFSEFVCFGV